MSSQSLFYVLNNALILTNNQLSSFTTDSEFDDRLMLTFGNTIDTQFYRQLWNSPDFSLESVIEIRSSSELNGANGAFSRDTGKIYLAEEFLQQFPPFKGGLGGIEPFKGGLGGIGAIDNIVSVILEEYGHLIDAQVNPVETVGDEGAIFALSVQGETITKEQLQSLQSEDDTATIVLDGQTVIIEQITLTEDPGDRPGNAYDVGLLNRLRSFSQTVSPTDTIDYYRFTLNDFSEVTVSLSESTGNGRLSMWQDVNNNGISESGESIYDVGSSTDEVTVNLNSGTYFVRILSDSNNETSYNLDLTGTVINNPNPPTNPGNRLGEAYNVGLLNTPQSFSQTVTAIGTTDYYRFTLDDFSQVSLSLSEPRGGANLSIVQDANNNGIFESGELIYNVIDVNNNRDDRVTLNLNSGTYFVRVLSVNNNASSYDLDLTGTVINNPNPPVNPGNRPGEAYNIGLLNTSQSFTQTITLIDTTDYYRFTIDDFSQVSLSLTRSSGSGRADLSIVQDVNNNGIRDSGEFIHFVGNNQETINLNSGTYFARVALNTLNTSNAISYNLDLSGTVINNPNPPVNPGDSPRDAYDLGLLNTPKNLTQTVTPIDTTDYYRFTLDDFSQVSISLIESTGDAELSIWQDLNNNGSSDSGELLSNFSDEVTVNLNSGIYFLRVLSDDNDATSYNLNLNGIALDNPNPPINPGNSPGEAYNIGLLNTQQNFSQTVNPTDPTDYYQFSLYYSSEVSLSLSELTGNATLSIWQDVNNNGISDSGEFITDFFGNAGNINLDSGTYFVSVFSGSSGVNNYNLNLSATALNNDLTLVQGTAQIAYVAYYGRPADPGGLDYWNGRLGDERISYSPRSGDSLTDPERNVYNELVSGFGNAEEANRVFDGLTNRQRVNQVYQFAFNRDGDSGGLDYWTNQIDRGFVNLTTFALEVALGAQNEDFDLLVNKIESADSFSQGVETNPDGSAYSGSRGEIFGRDWLAGYGNTVASITDVNNALSDLNS